MSGAETVNGLIIDACALELDKATTKFAPFNTAHEGWAVIREELDELWDETKNDKRPAPERRKAMRLEAIQVAAMAMRFIRDCAWEDGS